MNIELNGMPDIEWQTQEDVAIEVVTEALQHLIVWNDDVNTFDLVIQSLIEVCDHTQEQAEQCALLIHHKGQYSVKKGSFDYLRPRCEALIDRGLSATIGS